MMNSKCIVITSAHANVKVVNRLLLSLRDWEFGDEPTWDDSSILQHVEGSPDRTNVPMQEYEHTEFVGKTIEEVESIMLSKHKTDESSSLFLLLDDEGISNETIIIAENAMNMSEEEEDPSLYLDQFNKVRVPWIEAYIMWCNLDIANMGFEEYCVEGEAVDSSRWFTYKSIMGTDHYRPFLEKRDAILRELAKLDLA